MGKGMRRWSRAGVALALACSLVFVSLASAGVRSSQRQSSVTDSHPVGITGDYMVPVPCGSQGVPVGGTCSQSDAPVPYVSPAAHPDVFSLASAAVTSAPGSSVELWFYNAACAASPAIQVLVSAASKRVVVGTIASVPAYSWASGPVDFRMPDVGQVGSGSTYRGASFGLAFSAPLATCENGGTVVRGYFGISLHAGAPPPRSTCTGSQASVRALSDATSGLDTPCPLDVKVAPFGPSKAGLSYVGADKFTGFIKQYGPGQSKSVLGVSQTSACVSGCTKLLITVRDHASHAPVGNATVNVSVDALKPSTKSGAEVSSVFPPYSKPVPSQTGFLCDAAHPSHCEGNYLTGLKTDAHGHVAVLYWVPGLVFDATTAVTGRALCAPGQCTIGKKRCLSGCSVHRYEGASDTPLEVASTRLCCPGQKLLSEDDAVDLGKWATPDQTVSFFSNPVLNRLFTILVKREIDLSPVGLTADALASYQAATAQRKVEIGFAAMILNLFHLSAYGLGDGAAKGAPNALMDKDFVNAFAGTGGTKASGGIGTKGGMLWQYGEALRGAGKQVVTLSVYEVSYCVERADCGPGYYLGGASRLYGIEPYLDFVLYSQDYPDFDRARRGEQKVEYDFVGQLLVPYDAAAWFGVQYGKASSP